MLPNPATVSNTKYPPNHSQRHPSQLPWLPSSRAPTITTRLSNLLLLDNTLILTIPIPLALRLSPRPASTTGDHYLPPFISSSLLEHSKVTSKTTTFLKPSHHKLTWTTDCLGTVVFLKLLKVKVCKVKNIKVYTYFAIDLYNFY